MTNEPTLPPISSIELHIPEIPCYSKKVIISDLGDVNIFYGQNGSGKSTKSRFFASLQAPKNTHPFNNCSIPSFNHEDYTLHVYNEDFKKENFEIRKDDGLKSIITIDKKNTDIENKINESNEQIKANTIYLEEQKKQLSDLNSKADSLKDKHFKQVWEAHDLLVDSATNVRDVYRNTVLEGLGNSRAKCFDTIRQHFTESDDSLNKEDTVTIIWRNILQIIDLQKGDNRKSDYKPVPQLSFEHEELLLASIQGSDNPYLTTLIEAFNNTSNFKPWFQKGSVIIKEYNSTKCPLCSSPLSEDRKQEITQVIDEQYHNSVKKIEESATTYDATAKQLITILEGYDSIYTYDASIKQDFLDLQEKIAYNLSRLKNKINDPKSLVMLENTTNLIDSINEKIERVNEENDRFNQDITDKRAKITQLKNDCLNALSRLYKETFTEHNLEVPKLESERTETTNKIIQIKQAILNCEEEIDDLKAKRKNVLPAITKINELLGQLGVPDLKIKHESFGEEVKYFLSRDNLDDTKVYETLSEGEKTIIAFLYFLETCQLENDNNHIVIIDDPISSLSLQAVFEVRSLIKSKFIKGKAELHPNVKQLFILTHQLTFYNALKQMDIKDKEDKYKFKYFKVDRSGDGLTKFENIKHDDLNNRFDALWMSLARFKKDPGEHSNLHIPNTMRQILEHHFAYVCGNGNSWNNYTEEIKGDLYTYVNRLSHSDQRNLDDDLHTIEPDKYFVVFEKIFDKAGYIAFYRNQLRRYNFHKSN
jgi:wobble nucleotide-excising tRNase